jgi:hypothetical protein
MNSVKESEGGGSAEHADLKNNIQFATTDQYYTLLTALTADPPHSLSR